jgi:GDP/UDP-N,N'-diacetylbacillosamine 2-epimerase (hydrolysing)
MKFGILTTSRADYGIYRPLLEKLKEKRSDFVLLVTGSHTSDTYGATIKIIERDGYPFIATRDVLIHGTTRDGVMRNMAETSFQISSLVGKEKFDAFICLGDRYEMLAAASILIPLGKPLVHLHGGEITSGAMDDKFRHALTKLADYHFCSCEEYRERIIQMGEDPEKVFNVGALSLDNIETLELQAPLNIFEKLGWNISSKYCMACFHPETDNSNSQMVDLESFLSAMEKVDIGIVITGTNADIQGGEYRRRIEEWAKKRKNVFIKDTLGIKNYFSLLTECSFVIGNSSSGIIEVASFKKPVVNIGDRQNGRARSLNVIDCKSDTESILEAISLASKKDFSSVENIYKRKKPAAEEILKVLLNSKLSQNFEFYDYKADHK